MKARRRFKVSVFLNLQIVLVFLFTTIQTTSSATSHATGDVGPAFASQPVQKRASLFFDNGVRPQALAALDQKVLRYASEEWHSYPLFGGEMTSIAMGAVITQATGFLETVYVGTRDAGIFETVDGCASWQPARTGLTYWPIRSLRVDPLRPSILYAGMDFDGIWKSTDSGAILGSSQAVAWMKT